MKKLNLTTFLFCVVFLTQAQQVKLAPPDDHYKTLQQYSGAAVPGRAWMDSVRYPPSEYGSSITYLLARPHYLSQDQVEALAGSVTAPANSSEQVRKELDYLLQLQERRTPEDIKRVEFLGDIGYWPPVNLVPLHPHYRQNLQDLFFEGREVIGPELTAESFPAIRRLLEGVMLDMRIMEFTVKYKILRPRPYHLESGLRPLARISSPSFASGHTLWAFLQAFVWSEIIPGKRSAFIALAEEIRRSREVLGIHYPSDNEAARQIAYKMLQLYFRNAAFRKDLKAATDEWRSAAARHGITE